MPAPKKPVEQPDVESENRALRAQVQELQELLTSPTVAPVDATTELLARLVALQEQQATAQVAEREVAMNEQAAAVLTEGEHLEGLPEAEHPLDHYEVFASKGKNLTIIKKPRRALADAEGNTWLRPGQHVTFAPQGEFRTNDPELIEWLKGRGSYGREFWLASDPPGGNVDPAIALERVGQYLADLNMNGLNEMEAEERAGQNRAQVMQFIKVAQRQCEVAKAKYPAPSVEPA